MSNRRARQKDGRNHQVQREEEEATFVRPPSPTTLGVSVIPVLLTTTLSQALLSLTYGKRQMELDVCDSWYQTERGISAI